MSNRDLLLDVIDQLTQEAQSLRMAQTVQRSAYLLLARHLAKLQLIQPDALESDLRLMAEAQPDEGWQAGHVEIASELRLACAGR